jgi:hypothetical protein
MGIDFLDVAMELEKQFGVLIEPDDILDLWKLHENDCTAADLHDVICRKCKMVGVPVPRRSWNRVKSSLVRSLGVRPSQVKRDAWLRRDLRFD